MAYRFLDHTADIAVEIAAGSLGDLFAEALVAFAEVVTEPARIEERLVRHFELAAPGPDLLLVDWLTELLYAFESEGLLFRRAEVDVAAAAGGFRLVADAHGEPRDDARHPIKVLVKAVTYHGLVIEETAQGFRARVVFDI